MKKRMVTLALATLPLAAAQAQSSVTIYGVVDAAVTVRDPGGTGSRDYQVDSGVGPGSRLGFTGREDLGGGLRANFTMEMGFDSSTGAFQQGGLTWGRQVWVGLGGAAWTLTAGRQYSPNLIALAVTDAFGQIYWNSSSGYGIGTLQNPTGAGVIGSGCQGATARVNNSVQGTYTLGPVTTKLMLAAGDENARGTGRLANTSVTYTAGPLMVTGGYARVRQCATDLAAGATPDWQTEIAFGGTYDFGAAKLFAGYYNWNPSEQNKVVTPAVYTNHKVMWLGTRVPVGGHAILAQATRFRQDFRGASDARGLGLAVTYEHSLSKRTRLYASSGYVKNDARASFGSVAATAAIAAGGAGADPKVLSLGITHLF